MKKNTIKINEASLRKMVAHTLKSVLKEGTTKDWIYNAWCQLEDTVGAQQMLDCIYNWLSSNQLEQIIKWFEEEGYIDSEDIEY